MIKKIFLSKEDLSDFETQWHPSEMEGYFVTKEQLRAGFIEILAEYLEVGSYHHDYDDIFDQWLKSKEGTPCQRCGKSLPENNGVHSCVINEGER